MACPFAKLRISDEGKTPLVAKPGEAASVADETGRVERESGEKTGASKCPFGFDKKTLMKDADDAVIVAQSEEREGGQYPFGFDKKTAVKEADDSGIGAQSEEREGEVAQCPFGYGKNDDGESKDGDSVTELYEQGKEESIEAASGGKCPLGYDSVSFKIGPFSCVLCKALLYESSRCVPCRHIYCRACISRFHDCPLCGLDIDGIEPDPDMQGLVDRFVEGHARIRRPTAQSDVDESSAGNVKYADVSIERGSFLVQHAMRAFEAKNLESAKARLGLCVTDCREELSRSGATSTNCSQLGALLGMLGDCCRAMEDTDGAIENYEESVGLLTKLSDRDAEVVHALSVSLNKLGDLKYYAQELASARDFYARALNVRLEATTDFTTLSPQLLDVAVSLAKVADVDFALGNESAAAEGFREALKKLENLAPPKTGDTAILEKKRLSVMTFLQSQLPAST